MKEKYDIFISYSRKDIEKVRPIINDLEARDFKVWLDLSNIDYGDTFPDRIAEALDASDSLLFMCTPNSLLAPYCKKEIGYARTNGKMIRAILVDGKMPKQGWFALDYQDVNCINITKDEQKRKFIEDIESVYQPEKAAKRALKIEEAKAAARRKVLEEEKKRIQEAEQKARDEELARLRRKEEERIRKVAEEKARKEAEQKAREEELARLRRKEEEERIRKVAEEKARKEAEQNAREAQRIHKETKDTETESTITTNENPILSFFIMLCLFGIVFLLVFIIKACGDAIFY